MRPGTSVIVVDEIITRRRRRARLHDERASRCRGRLAHEQGGVLMDAPFHRFSELFAQLGLANDAAAVERFIAEHAPLDGDVRLEDAPFWTAAQAQFLREAMGEDSDWAELADQLNTALRQT